MSDKNKPADDKGKDTSKDAPRSVPGQEAGKFVNDDQTPPTGPQSGALSPFGGNRSPALEDWVKRVSGDARGEEVSREGMHPDQLDPSPQPVVPDPRPPVKSEEKK